MRRSERVWRKAVCWAIGHDFEVIQALPVGSGHLMGCYRCHRLFLLSDWAGEETLEPWDYALGEFIRNQFPTFILMDDYYERRNK